MDAQRLLQDLIDGPSMFASDDPFSPIPRPYRAVAAEKYELWANSWIIPLVKRLVPELKEKK